jgi:hypothetical protein
MTNIKIAQDELDKIEKLGELAQEKDRADTRQRQILADLQPETIRAYLATQHEEKFNKWTGTIAKWALNLILPILFAVASTYFVTTPTYYSDKTAIQKQILEVENNSSKAVQQITNQVTGISRQMDSQDRQILRNSEAIGNLRENYAGIKSTVDNLRNRQIKPEPNNGN